MNIFDLTFLLYFSTTVSNKILIMIKIQHTWKTVTMAQTNESKFDRANVIWPCLSLNTNFPPKICIPKMANVNMKRNKSAKNVITDVVVRSITVIWCLIGRINRKIRSKRSDRKIVKLPELFVSLIRSSIILCRRENYN